LRGFFVILKPIEKTINHIGLIVFAQHFSAGAGLLLGQRRENKAHSKPYGRSWVGLKDVLG